MAATANLAGPRGSAAPPSPRPLESSRSRRASLCCSRGRAAGSGAGLWRTAQPELHRAAAPSAEQPATAVRARQSRSAGNESRIGGAKQGPSAWDSNAEHWRRRRSGTEAGTSTSSAGRRRGQQAREQGGWDSSDGGPRSRAQQVPQWDEDDYDVDHDASDDDYDKSSSSAFFNSWTLLLLGVPLLFIVGPALLQHPWWLLSAPTALAVLPTLMKVLKPIAAQVWRVLLYTAGKPIWNAASRAHSQQGRSWYDTDYQKEADRQSGRWRDADDQGQAWSDEWDWSEDDVGYRSPASADTQSRPTSRTPMLPERIQEQGAGQRGPYYARMYSSTRRQQKSGVRSESARRRTQGPEIVRSRSKDLGGWDEGLKH
eukprot:SM000307S11694  [mRNA]  locus=s307:99608:101749:- [translate_table: standard]